MSEREDEQEIEALARQLNAAFASARPRPEFDDELWQRIRARGGLPLRLREAWEAFRQGPFVATATGVAALVLVGVIAFVALRAGGGGGAGSPATTAGGAARPQAYLPVPSLKATTGPAAAVGSDLSGPPTVTPYYGPADLSWSGTLPTLPTAATVLAFQQPGPDTLSNFTAQAALPSAYSLTADLTGAEPRYSVTLQAQPQAGPAPSDQDARKAADSFLNTYRLIPPWPAEVVAVRAPDGTVTIHYFRQFAVAGAGPAVEIDESGTLTGVSVLVGPGPTVEDVTGPLPVQERTLTYPMRPGESIVAAALSSQPLVDQPAGGSLPKVALTRATLVYIAVRPGYYEPAVLFTGSFAVGNQLYEKRVLVPAVDPSRLSR